jgi:hypothetical protein
MLDLGDALETGRLSHLNNLLAGFRKTSGGILRPLREGKL